MARVVALTGGIGSGKSTVARMLADLGAAIIDADQLARTAVAPEHGLRAIVARFGARVLQADGTLDRKALGEIVFADPTARKDLEAITHPVVARLAAEAIQAASAKAEVVVYDVPLFFENRLQSLFPEVIVVDASDAVRQKRIRERDGLAEDAIRMRMNAQIPLDAKVKQATWVVHNGQDLANTKAQVSALFAKLTRKEKS